MPLTRAPFTRRNELVYDDLGAVGKVAELCFPDHQRVGVGGGIAVFGSPAPPPPTKWNRSPQTAPAIRPHSAAAHRSRRPIFRGFGQITACRCSEHATAAPPRQAHWAATGDQGCKGHVFAHAPTYVESPHGPMAARSSYTFSTSWCGVTLAGRWSVAQPAGATRPLTAVPALSVHFAEEGRPVHSVLALEIGQDRIKSIFCPRPKQRVWPDQSSPSVAPRPCAASLSAYSLRVPGWALIFCTSAAGSALGVLLVVAQLCGSR